MNDPLPDFVEPLGDGVHAIDTGFVRPRFDAAYLLVDGGQAAFIDTGTQHAVPRLLAALDALGLPRQAVTHIIPTHVHLDHGGGVGGLARELPQAQVWVHPRGARHLVDPAALWAGATEVYGADEMVRSYGEVVPLPSQRVHATTDGETLAFGGRELQFIDTPGHARHHHCIWDSRTRGWFTGDTFGLSYREFDTPAGQWMLPTSTPVQFEPELLQASVLRLLARQPSMVFLTHYGRVTDVAARGAQLLALLQEMADLGRALRDDPDRHEALKRGQLAMFLRSLAAHGCAMPAAEVAERLAVDLQLNAQGMAAWLDRDARRRAA